MLVALIADTHLPRGRRRLPQRCIEIIRGCELLIHAGDVATAPVLAEIESIGPPAVAVHGNVDCPELRRKLPPSRTVSLDAVAIGVVHDPGPSTGRVERLGRLFPSAQAVVFGHTHIPEHREVDSFQIFNPGSPTERRQAPNRSMGIARVTAGTIDFEHIPL